MLNIWFSPTIYMFMKRAATTAYIIRVQMQQNETIIFFFVSTRIAMLKVLLPSSKLLRNKGDISEKLSTAKREIETMLSACLNQKISWINEEKKKRKNNCFIKRCCTLEIHLNASKQQHDLTVPMTVCGRENL
jgi:hypothetical protein